jgi:hypothetical protein
MPANGTEVQTDERDAPGVAIEVEVRDLAGTRSAGSLETPAHSVELGARRPGLRTRRESRRAVCAL